MVAKLAEVAVLAGPGLGGGKGRRGRSGVSSSGGERQWLSEGKVARGVSGMPPPPLLLLLPPPPPPPTPPTPPLPVPPPQLLSLPPPPPPPPGCILGAPWSRQPSSVCMGEGNVLCPSAWARGTRAGRGESCSGRACVDVCVRPRERASPGAQRLPRAEPGAGRGPARGGGGSKGDGTGRGPEGGGRRKGGK